MKLSFLNSLFTKEKKLLTLPDSLLIKKLKELSLEHKLSIFDNVTIFHHTHKYHFPLIILDETRGLYIFEKKEWAYDDLKNATVEKAKHQQVSQDTLAFENKQDIIHQKLNELTHSSNLPTYNYLLMENLNADEYEHLDVSFKELMPSQKVIFSDSLKENILEKLHNSPKSLTPLNSKNEILGNLLVQYTILDKKRKLKFCTKNQIESINHEIFGLESLHAPERSGKTNTLLLKAIFHVLTHKNSQVLIIKPTLLACDILKQKLLDIIEHAIIDFDILDVLIVTPREVLEIKRSEIPRLILCDDANLLNNDFIQQLIEIQKEANLLLVNYAVGNQTLTLDDNFTSTERLITFHHANKLAKTLRLIAKFLKVSKADEIFVLSNADSRTKIRDDLKYFIEEETLFLDVNEHLKLRTLNSIVFLDTPNIDELTPKHLIILDTLEKDRNQIKQSVSKAQKSVDFIYETPTDFITTLKEEYESNKN